jgi:hypothetical protein
MRMKQSRTSLLFLRQFLTLFAFMIGLGVNGQTLISETLRSGSIPSGWTQVDVSFTTAASGYANISGTTGVLTTPVFNASAFASIDLDFSVAKFGSGGDGPLTVEYSIDGGSNWVTQGNSTTPTSSTYQSNSISIPAASATMQVRFTTVNSPSAKRLRDVLIVGVGTAGTPAISFNVANITNLDYQFGSGPSTSQSYEVSGSNLTGSGNISISAPANFEISLDNINFSSSESLPFTAGQITGQPVTVHVRLANSLAVNSYNGDIEHSGGGATQTDLPVSGDVIAPPPAITATGLAGAYFEDFKDFVSLATLPNGWSLSGTVTTYNGDWGSGTGAGLRGNDEVLGYQHTLNTGTFISTLTLLNETGNPITDLNVSYLGKVERATEGRTPEFTVTIDGGAPITALAYSTSSGSDQSLSTLISGLNIPDNATFEISWSSTNGCCAGSSRQIGISNVEVFVPDPTGIFPPANLNLNLAARDVISLDVTANPDNDPVIVVTNNTSTFGEPVDGVSYSNGDPIPGGGTVLYVGAAAGVPNHTGRSEDTEYFYRVWSVATGDEYSDNFVSGSIRTPVGTVALPYSTDFVVNPFDNNVWIQRDIQGPQSWVHNTGFGGRVDMQGGANSTSCEDNEDWLISPPVDLSVNNDVVVNATISERFGGLNLVMLYSDDYDGFGDPNDFSWDVMETIATSATSATPEVNNISNADLQAVSSNRVYVAFRYVSNPSVTCAEWRIEDFEIVFSTSPTLVATGSPTPFSTVQGIPSAEQIIEVSGDDLQDDITVTAPTGFEVSLSSGSGYGTSVAIPFGSGTVADTDVYVRLTGAAAGSFVGNIEVSSPLAVSQTINVEGQVSAPPPAITATGPAGAYFENFQDFVSAATLPDGWALSGSVTTYGGNWGSGTGAGTRGNDTVLGYQHTGGTGVFTSELSLLNSSGSTITSLEVSYRGKVERATEGRSPAFDVQIDGVSYPVLTYSTSGGVDADVSAIITGLSIANNQVFEISWSSDRDLSGSGSSRQIGLTNVQVMIPQPATVTIEDLGSQILAGNLPQGQQDHVLHQSEVVAVQNPALVTSVAYELDGTYDASDIVNFKLRYSTNATLDPSDPTLGTVTTIPSTGNDVVFSGLSQSIAEAATGYFYLTTDVDFNAAIGNTIAAKAPIFNFAAANNNNQGTNTSSDGGLQTIIASAASVELSSTNPMTAASNLPQGDSNVVIGAFSLEVSDANAALTEIEIEFAGNFDDTDIDSIALYFTFGSSFSTDTLLQMNTGVTGAGTFVFDGFSQGILDGQTGNFYLAAFVSCNATVGRELSVQALSPGDFSFSGAANVTGSSFASGTHTVTVTAPNDVSNLALTSGNQELVVSWDNPTGCFDEVLVVVAENAANTGIPSGTTFSADANFGDGGALGNGFVAFYGTGTGVTLTGLTNNETYFVKVFVRNGSTWSTGVEDDEVPVEICFSESFVNVPAGGSFPNTGNYGDRSWTGDSGNDIDATDSRSDQPIAGSPAVLIRNGRLRVQNIANGVGALTITTQRFFGGTNADLTIALDGNVVGTVPYSDVPQTTTISLGFPGSFDSLTITTPQNGDRVSISNLQWLCEEDADFTWDGTQWVPQTPAGNATNTDVINVRGANPPTLPSGSNVQARRLVINPGNDLIVGPGSRIEITDSIVNSGKIILEANANDGPAHLIHNTPSAGIVQAAQHLTGPLPGNDNKWVHMGAAAEVVINSLAEGGSVMNNTSVFVWDANDANWTAVDPSSATFQRGVGYTIFAGTNQFGSFLRPLPGNISFEGEVTRGDQDVTVPVGYNDGQNSNPNFAVGAVTAATEGWNFLSNPWPAAYDLNGPNAHTGVTFYQYGDGSYQSYLPGVTAVSNNNNLVPPMGGFWIQNSGNSLNSFTFDRANRIAASGTVLKRGGGQSFGEAYIDVQARIAGRGITETTLIVFSRRGNNAFLRTEDAIKRRNDYGIPNMYTRADGLDCAIQSLPELDQNYRMPLYFDPSGADAVVELGLDRSKLKDGLQVFLEDKQQNAFVLLSENDYHFVANSSSQIDRFMLHFTYDQTVNVESFKNATSFNAWVYRSEIFLKNPDAQTLSVQIVDMAGRVLLTQITSEEDQIIPIPNGLSAGVYLLKVNAGGKQVRTVKFVQP